MSLVPSEWTAAAAMLLIPLLVRPGRALVAARLVRGSHTTVDWRFDVAVGDPATALIAVAHDHEARAIVVGGRSHGLVGGLVVGSVAQKLVRHSPVSVLVVRDGKAHRLDVATHGGKSHPGGV